MARGGKNYPASPAPVSGPGRMSRRTDGGAGNASQPIRTPTGGDYGSGKALAEQQQGAPLPVATAGAPAATPLPPTPPGALPVPGGVFGPTERPGESPTAGVIGASTPVPNVDDALRALYSVFPHPQLLQLIRKG